MEASSLSSNPSPYEVPSKGTLRVSFRLRAEGFGFRGGGMVLST